ncbi:unnamed protein product, partial [Staurois parvus]
CRVSFSVSVLILYVWTLHSPTSPVLDAGCNSQYLPLFCMYGLCTVPLLLSCMPGVILGICPYSVCMDSAQSPLLLSCIPGVILGICPYSVCMDSAQSHISCP